MKQIINKNTSIKSVSFISNFISKIISKKAQSEMLGLVIIVAFIIFVIFFAVFLTLSNQDNTTVLDYRMNSMTANMLTTVFRTTSCGGYSVSELLIDCSKSSPSIVCTQQGITANSCFWARDTLGRVFERTLDEWNERYEFNISDMTYDFYFSHGDCENISLGKEPSFLPIPVVDTGNTLLAELSLCK